MTAATLATAMSAENRKAIVAGTIGNVLEWYDFGVYGYLATTMSQLFFPGEDKTISLLKAFAVFGVGRAGTNPARCLEALAGTVCWRRVGRIDFLHRRIRT